MKAARAATSLLRRTALDVAVAACFIGVAQANPTGPSVVSGAATFAVSGKSLNVTSAPGAIINWQGFSIKADELTRFIQQNAQSAVLNRVTSQEQSAILGQLLSNGRVYLINPNGITVGAGAHIDTAGFVASSLKLSDSDALAGKFKLQDTGSSGKVVNNGAITTTRGGFVYLVAPDVENNGIITSPKGEIILAAGKSVELVDSQKPELRGLLTAPENTAVNVGKMIAEAGDIGIFAGEIKQSGLISANSAVVGENGKIILKAKKNITLDADSKTEASGPQGGSITAQAEGGTLLASGAIEANGASGTGGTGGTVQLLGDKVGLLDNATVTGNGDRGGGTIRVGGDFHGANPDVQNANRTYVGPNASINADAITSGDGGKVIVWSENATRAYGTITAKGGAQAGNGGFIEVSGKDFLDFSARIDASAPKGAYGTLLLDPADINVANGGPGLLTDVDAFADLMTPVTIAPTTLNSAAATVVLQATNDITVSDPVTLTTPGKGFVAQAGNNININAAVTTNGGNIHLEADSPHSPSGGGDGVGLVKIAAPVSTLGGGVTGGAITLIGGG